MEQSTSNWNLEMLVLRRRENQNIQRKASHSKEENQQQTHPTYEVGSGNQTRDTLVGGKRSHHCSIPAPRISLESKE